MTSQFLFGVHAIEAVLKYRPDQIKRLHVQEGLDSHKLSKLIHQARSQQIAVEFTKKNTLDRMTNAAVHQGIVALIATVKPWDEVDLSEHLTHLNKPPFLLCLDGVQDPHNLGACFRTALAAGVDAIIAPKNQSCGLTPIVHKVAVGAASLLPFVQVTNLTRCMETLKQTGIWFVGADMTNAKPLYDIDLTGPIAWVLGAEGKGLKDNTKKHCDHLAYIPMNPAVESLNVSVATGICLFETQRQQRQV